MLYVPRVIFAVLADAVKIHRVIFDRTSEIFRCYVLDFADVTHCKVCHAVTFSANKWYAWSIHAVALLLNAYLS